MQELSKRNKGKIIREWQNDYVVIDCETTGLYPGYDEIIEFAAAKIRNCEIVDTYSTLIKPKIKIDSFIEELTGITNKMVLNAPTIKEKINEIMSFIGDDIIVGHFVHFDINFLYDEILNNLSLSFDNDRMDTCFLARKIYPKFRNHKLSTLAESLNLQYKPSHRSMPDVLATYSLYEHLKQVSLEKNISIKKHKISASDITLSTTSFIDEDNMFYDKNICFTGTLNIPRKEAMQIVTNIGGHPIDSVNKNCDFLVMGIQDYRKIKDGCKSSKHLKAEQLIKKGYDIKILTEDAFMDAIKN